LVVSEFLLSIVSEFLLSKLVLMVLLIF